MHGSAQDRRAVIMIQDLMALAAAWRAESPGVTESRQQSLDRDWRAAVAKCGDARLLWGVIQDPSSHELPVEWRTRLFERAFDLGLRDVDFLSGLRWQLQYYHDTDKMEYREVIQEKLGSRHTVRAFRVHYGEHLRSLIGMPWRRALAVYSSVYCPNPGGLDCHDDLVIEVGARRAIVSIDASFGGSQVLLHFGSAEDKLPRPVHWIDYEDQAGYEDRNPSWQELPLPGLEGQILEACCVIGSSVQPAGPRSRVDGAARDEAWLVGFELHFPAGCVGVSISTSAAEQWCFARGGCPWPWPETIVWREWIR